MVTVVSSVGALVIGFGKFLAEPSTGDVMTREAFGDEVTHSSASVARTDSRALRGRECANKVGWVGGNGVSEA